MISATPNRDDLAAYLDMIFGYVEADDTCIALRGVGEKGTDGEGGFREAVIVPGVQNTFDVDRIFGHIQRWSSFKRASFIVPGAIDNRALSDNHATEDRVRYLTAIIVDIDKGDTNAKKDHAEKYLGKASMVVHSGGVTETGAPKMHLYWRLSEASDAVNRIAANRKSLALKVGGDAAFGRSTQVIRIPGSIYGKGGASRPCFIADRTSYEYDLDDILAAIEAMPVMEGIEVDESKLAPMLSPVLYSQPGGGLNFSSFKAANGDLLDKKNDLAAVLTSDIHEGGDGDKHRWGEFNKVAGLHIHQARAGLITIEEARTHTETWMMAHMSPPWPPIRFNNEWQGLVGHDIKKKGPLPGVAEAEGPPGQAGKRKSERLNLAAWDINKWTLGEPPPVRWIAERLVATESAHIFCAEPGAGKTNLMIWMAMCVAAKQPDDDLKFLGTDIPNDAAGTAVILTMEDGQNSVHRRIHRMDPSRSMRKRMGNRCRIVPFPSAGGAFKFVKYDKGGEPVHTERCEELLEELRGISDLKLVVVDTLATTAHDENDNTAVGEYLQAIMPTICGDLGAALVITHHPRKESNNAPAIYQPVGYLSEIRGASALTGNVRAMLVMWEAPDYSAKMKLLGMAPQSSRLFYYGVGKANEFGFFEPHETRAAIRSSNGVLEDVTARLAEAGHSELAAKKAWMVKAIEVCAASFHPLNKTGSNGFFARRGQLPAAISALPRAEYETLVGDLLAERLIKMGGGTLKYLDVPGGHIDRNDGPGNGGYEVEKGTWSPPEWEREFVYDPILGRVVGVHERHPMSR